MTWNHTIFKKLLSLVTQKVPKKFPYFFFGRYFFGKKHACGTTIICIQEQEPKENKATSKRLITEAWLD